MLDYVGEYEGTKERISKAFKIKDHFMVWKLFLKFFLVVQCMPPTAQNM